MTKYSFDETPTTLIRQPINNSITLAQWGEWSTYGACSATCGPGEAIKTRVCPGGDTCQTDGDGERETSKKLCDDGDCPGMIHNTITT